MATESGKWTAAPADTDHVTLPSIDRAGSLTSTTPYATVAVPEMSVSPSKTSAPYPFFVKPAEPVARPRMTTLFRADDTFTIGMRPEPKSQMRFVPETQSCPTRIDAPFVTTTDAVSPGAGSEGIDFSPSRRRVLKPVTISGL